MNISLYNPSSETTIKHSLNNVSDSLIQLHQRLQKEVAFKSLFKINHKAGNYHFDFYAPSLRLAIQVDAHSYSYSDIYNSDQIKVMSISHKDITVIKISDYQILMDCDEIVRFIKNYSKTEASHADTPRFA